MNADKLFEVSALKNMAVVLTTEGHQMPLYNAKSIKSLAANWKLNCWPGRKKKARETLSESETQIKECMTEALGAAASLPLALSLACSASPGF